MKKLNKMGFSHLEALIVIVVLVAVGALGYFAYNRFKANNSSSAGAGSYVGKVKRYQDITGGKGTQRINNVVYRLVPQGSTVTEINAQFLPKNINVKSCSHFRVLATVNPSVISAGKKYQARVRITETGSGASHVATFSGNTTYNICTGYKYTGSKGRNFGIKVKAESGNIGVDTMYYKR